MLDNNWRMRNIGGPANGGPPQDFTTGSAADNLTGRFMLNTDICLAWNIDDALPISSPRCCTKGTSSCAQCPTYPTTNSRRQAANAVAAFKSCTTNNDCFYKAFISAWNRATVLGQGGANKSLSLTCVWKKWWNMVVVVCERMIIFCVYHALYYLVRHFILCCVLKRFLLLHIYHVCLNGNRSK